MTAATLGLLALALPALPSAAAIAADEDVRTWVHVVGQKFTNLDATNDFTIASPHNYTVQSRETTLQFSYHYNAVNNNAVNRQNFLVNAATLQDLDTTDVIAQCTTLQLTIQPSSSQAVAGTMDCQTGTRDAIPGHSLRLWYNVSVDIDVALTGSMAYFSVIQQETVSDPVPGQIATLGPGNSNAVMTAFEDAVGLSGLELASLFGILILVLVAWAHTASIMVRFLLAFVPLLLFVATVPYLGGWPGAVPYAILAGAGGAGLTVLTGLAWMARRRAKGPMGQLMG